MSEEAPLVRRVGRWFLNPGAWGCALLLAAAHGPRLADGLTGALNEPLPLWAIVRELAHLGRWGMAQSLPVLLALVLAGGLGRRGRATALAAIVGVLIGCDVIGPLASSRTNEINARVITVGAPLMPAPHGWSWPQRLEAMRSGVDPDGAPLNAVTRREIVQQELAFVLLPLLAAFTLSPLLLRTPRRLNLWIAVVACIVPGLVGASLFRVMMQAGLPATVRTLLGLLPHAGVACLLLAICLPAGEASRRARLGWLSAAGVAGAVVALAIVVPQAIARLAPGVARVGHPAPAIEVTSLDGSPMRLEPGAGKVVVLSYWASWCGPCRAEQAFLEELSASDAGRSLVVVAANNGESTQVAREAWTRLGLKRPAALPTAELLRRYPAASLPSSYVIDKRGVVRSIHAGFVRDEMEPELRALLAEP